jgi:two-component system, chemotaxis family, chemotaxis protein CheY
MSKTIMAVDDSISIRQMVGFTLAREGYDVLEAVNGEDAEKKLDVNDVHMMITDLNMPKMNGIELIKKVREKPKYRFMPIVMLTTESHESSLLEGKAAGATGWIIKPFKPDQLVGVVKKLLR